MSFPSISRAKNSPFASTPAIHADPPQPNLRLLALDGGGIRGLSSLLILQDIMDQIRRNLKLQETPPPCEYFDLICGTSTGGLIAILLGRLRMSVNDAIRVYVSFAKQVFAAKATRHLSPNKFDHKKFEDVIKLTIKDLTGDVDAPMADPLGTSCCSVFVLAVQKHAPVGEPTLLRTYSSPEADPAPCSIWQAARATTAASSFFKSINIPIRAGGIEAELVDAGLGFNNPTEQAFNEAIRIWGRSRPIGCLLSIGTGHPKIIGINGLTRISTLYNVAKACAAIATDCEKTHENVLRLVNTSIQFRNSSYTRFNVDQGMQDVGLEEWDMMPRVVTHTHNYLSKGEVQEKKRKCVENMMAVSEDQPSGQRSSDGSTTRDPPPNTLQQSWVEDTIVGVSSASATESSPVREIQQITTTSRAVPITVSGATPSSSTLPLPPRISLQSQALSERGIMWQNYWHSPHVFSSGTSYPTPATESNIEQFLLRLTTDSGMVDGDIEQSLPGGSNTPRMETKLARVMHQYRDAMVKQIKLFPEADQQQAVFWHMVQAANGLMTRDSGTSRTLLHYMAMNGVSDLLSVLVDAGFSVNDGDSDYRTPLHLAVIANHPSAVQVLIDQCGADVHARDLNRLLPWHCALAIDSDNIVENRERIASKAFILRLLASQTDPNQVKGRRASQILVQFKENPDAAIQ